MPDAVQLSIRNDREEIARVTAALEEFCEKHDVSPKDAYHFDLAFDELLTNVISYAYDDGGEHVITVHLRYADGVLEAEIVDDGRPFDPLTEAPGPDLEADVEQRQMGGLGVHFVKTFMDKVSYARAAGHNRVIFAKVVDPTAGRTGGDG